MHESKDFTVEQLARRSSNNEVILSALKDGPKTSAQLSKLLDPGNNFHHNIYDLRRKHDIDGRFTNGSFTYTYKGLSTKKPIEEFKHVYYLSQHWRVTREKRLVFDRRTCCQCHSQEDLHVHHWKYDLFSEQLCDLMTLCNTCHNRLHDLNSIRIKFPVTAEPDVYEKLVAVHNYFASKEQ